ncbi:hypothetical protein [Marivirga sp.]|uniref:hypothetical protein n=1 Tax=Marivirga sp. TaxID=2018662 RepID=UPI002D7F6B29|nr:hypothetical protein [Marivirga sp.]HET8860966.1 hypothetical protein [Marivirga sp.]
MNEAEQLYTEIGESMEDVKSGNMFGWKSFTYKRKPFLFFDKNSEQAVVFKVETDKLISTLDLAGTEIFNPGDKGKPMKNWVVVPIKHNYLWKDLALSAYENIIREVNHGKR